MGSESEIPPYAPTSNYQYRPSPAAANAGFSMDEPVRLYKTAAQRDLYESLAEIYSIIVTLDFVEKAYIRDTITHEEYTPTCLRLLAQYKTLLKNERLAQEFGDLASFKNKYNIDCPAATSRLEIGIPATVEQAVDDKTTANIAAATGNSGASSAKLAADATGSFITFMDALKLNYRAKDQLHPLLSELMTSLNKITTSDFEGRGKIVQWLITLNSMKATEELSDAQVRQMSFDVEHAYQAFYRTLE